MCALMPQKLKAGDIAPADGLYRVTHYQHRLPHLVSIIRGTLLPECQRCGDHVCFELTGRRPGALGVLDDSDFRSGTSD